MDERLAAPVQAKMANSSKGWDRLGAAAGAGYVVLALVGNGLAGEVTLSTSPNAFRIGTALEFVGFALFSVFIAYLFTTLGHRDGSWLPTAALISGIATLAVKLSTSAAWLVTASLRAGELGAEMDQTLDDIGLVGFQLTFFTFGLFLLTAGASLIRTNLVPRWLGWSGVILGTAGVVATNLPFDSDVAVLPFLLSLLWLAVLSLALWSETRKRLPREG
jgi:hypothetical protein